MHGQGSTDVCAQGMNAIRCCMINDESMERREQLIRAGACEGA